MTRPAVPVGVAVAALCVIYSGLCYLAGWLIPAAAAALLALAALILPWRIPPDDDGSDLEALIEATREQHPQYADWDTRELTQ